ncbi:tRNA dimethylallyltransferase [Pedobacter sp. UYP30]|uniref:tRNA (adenosine(37)-N6)-dimethylallyltransferase MiaA n=1 Tax=Pedobacter sp. UYP30 TaxID=1756400 RepID=UPI0033991A9B
MTKLKTLIAIVGPTAIGKTCMGIKVANYFDTEIISADSRQFYSEMSIGTAKPTVEELSQAKHHFINSTSINELFSIGDFETNALHVLDKIFATRNVAVLVGGSGMYVNALLNGLDDMPEIDLSIREKLNIQLATEGIESIKSQLQEIDPEYFEQVDQYNPQRMIRGLEVFLSTGQKLSALRSKTKKKRSFSVIKIGLNTDREKLYQQINKRVDEMMAAGLLSEVTSLKEFRQLNALKTVGYNELFEHLDGKISLEQAVTSIKQNTRRFAKRQLTWFRKDEEIHWFESNDQPKIISFLNSALANTN